MNDFTVHRLETEIVDLEKQKMLLTHNLGRLEPDLKREIEIIERKYGAMRIAIESKIKQHGSDIRSKTIQLDQLKKKMAREIDK